MKHKIWDISPRISHSDAGLLSPFSALQAQLLHNRGITNSTSAELFLKQDISLLHDPMLLPNMKPALARLQAAIPDKETVGIFGDFDADGITGTALLSEGMETLGYHVIPYLPHRTKEGHGLSHKAVEYFKEHGTTIIITVDCGTTSIDEIARAKELGIDTIITDHHEPLDELPVATAIVNPKLPNSAYPFPYLAGAGLAFKLIQGLCDRLMIDWDYSLLQLAAIGTIIDVTPITGENRYIVSAGLKSMNLNPKPGLQEILKLAGRYKDTIDTTSISFVIGPRINAPGRIEHCITSYNLLRATSNEQAYPLARELEAINRQRQSLTSTLSEIAFEQVSNHQQSKEILIIDHEEFTPGISGLLASKLSNYYYKPAIVMAPEVPSSDIFIGSCRSIPEFDLVNALGECGDIFIRFGGHKRAAGFTIARDNIDILRSTLTEIANLRLYELDLRPTIKVDANVKLNSITGPNFHFLQELAPHGEGNPLPTFLTRQVDVVKISRMGAESQHLHLTLKYQGAIWEATAFNLGTLWEDGTKSIDIVYNVGRGRRYKADNIQINIMDFRKSEKSA